MLGSLLDYLASKNILDVARDIVDVSIVYYLFYRALLVLRGTRAMQIGIGLFLVFGLYVVSYQLHLVTLLSILSALIPGAVILILVVVFQNDIRRGLMRMGSQQWFGVARTREAQAIDEVVEAATELAKHRIGAIITFEQDANLDEFVGVNKGHELDAAMSSELLVSIFVPEGVNKLHDGAVIIRNLRIAKAGVFFPMPDSRVLDPSFGSRHRAALGITEETDAVVVVVSEERGTIGFCFNGNIVGNLDGPGLRRALEGVFSPRKRRPKASPKSGAKREPISQRFGTDPVSIVTRLPEPGRSRAEGSEFEEDTTLVSIPAEPGETPTTRIRTTETEITMDRPASVPPPAPLRKAKKEKTDKGTITVNVTGGEKMAELPEPPAQPVVIPGAGRIPRLEPLTTPMRAPAAPRSQRNPAVEPVLPAPIDNGGHTPDSNDGGTT
jgi:diadenylate cyclase